ncbi:MAG: hypothetical protein PHW86_08170 [Candidatus Bipolaricaulis sp.]|nr:hypothetical protein [Candidatus Bipolaricaulis sp.]
MKRDKETSGYQLPYVSPILPIYEQEEQARPKTQPRMTWGTSNLSQLGYFLAAAGVMVMIIDVIGTVVDRFSLLFLWAPIVGVTLAIVLWKGVAWIRRRRAYRSKPFPHLSERLERGRARTTRAPRS